ncbi:MAG: Gfo/Idh/MocA family oxidoreductase [Candidatus Rokubacteria bacterium]|nr:Gfo/Idh/MocA family oxidoreductase [Candidatus Rokubacteria bacterium]
MTARPLTVGVVGLGFGRAHIVAFQANGCQVVAVCQRNREAAKAVADRYGVPAVYERWEDMLERATPDIVSIATPPVLHRTIATRAFEQGAHVLCEKPLAMTRADAEAMVEAATRRGCVAMTSFNARFTRAMQAFHARVAEGALGRVIHVSARWLGARWADESAAPTWRMDRRQAGHGAMGDMGVHLIDMIRWSFGELARVAAHGGVGYPSRTVPGGGTLADAEDYCTVLAELESGAQATFTVSRVARGANEHTLEVYGTGSALAYTMAREGPGWWDGQLRAATTGRSQPVDLGPPSPAPAGDALEITGRTTIAALVARMLEAIRTGAPASPSFEDGARAQTVLDAVREAIVRRAWIDVAR